MKKILFVLLAVFTLHFTHFNSQANAADPRFVDLNNGTMYDKVSKLIWLKNAMCYGLQNWPTAMQSASSLASGQCGLSDDTAAGDWHLPSIEELRIFVDAGYRSSTLNAAGFAGIPQDAYLYWSSSPGANPSFDAWAVYMYYGGVGVSPKSINNYVWPIRNGTWVVSSLSIIKPDTGSGIISSNPAGISCGSNCNASFISGQTVTLTATPDSGFVFASWSGCDYSNGNQCTVTVSGAKNVIATFNVPDTTPPAVTITSTPPENSNQASGNIVFTANEKATFDCKIDGGTFAPCTTPFSYSNLSNGQHTVTIKATDIAGNVSAPITHTWTVNTALAASSTILLPQTGQTKCFDTAGAEISCDGTGQDGDIQAGVPWPNTRFTDSGGQTMTDNLTGLIWSKNANLIATRDPAHDTDVYVQDGAVTWQHALDYIKKLNSENYLGYNDWRLPNINEQASIINNQQADLTLWLGNSQGFSNVPTTNYNAFWSSTSGSNRSTARIVSSRNSQLSNLDKTSFAYVWPVRGRQTGVLAIPRTGQTGCYNELGASRACADTGEDGELQTGTAWPTSRFTDNSFANNIDLTMSDTLTGLIWANDGNLAVPKKTWQDALSYVATLNQNNYLGYNDWRLPNRNELASLVDAQETVQSDWLNGQGFSLIQSCWSWSSSSVASNVTNAYDLGLGDGSVGVLNKAYNDCVWPVRGGYIAPRLNITKTGAGSITASTGTLTWDTSNTKATAYYEMGANTVVTLTAAPGTGLSTIWTGYDSFSGNTCAISMNMKKIITVTFSDITAPSAPTNIEVQAPAIKGELTITWTKPADTDFSHIHIYRSTASGTLGTLIGDNLSGIKFADTGLASQTRYYYTVHSVDAAGNESTNTAQVYGTTLDATPPGAATGITVSNPNTGGKLDLFWVKPNVTDFASITIYRSTVSGELGTAIATNQTGTSYGDTALINGTLYYYTLRAFDTSANYSDSSQTGGTAPTAPDTVAPGIINCTGTITQPAPLTGDRLQLSWSNPTDPDYALTRIYASTGSGLGDKIYEGSGTSYLHTGLTAGTTYKYTYHSVDNVGNETTNTTSCDYMPLDQAAPACPTELKATRNGDNSITLTWNRSASSDIYQYQVFASNGIDPISYATPATTITHPVVTWTSGALTPGNTYQFAIRPLDSIPITPNIATGCGIISATIPTTAPACSVSTGIKVPQTGKKLGGNRTTIMAELASGTEIELGSVTFQYRVSNPVNPWINIPSTDNITFPNPDTTKPWFIHWDITGLTDNTDYDIRSLATCTNAATDDNPGYITVTVNRANSDSDEHDNGNGEHEKTEVTGGDADSHIVKGDGDDKHVTSLTLPAGSTPEGTKVTVTESNPVTKAELVPADHQNGGTFREISFDDGRHTLDNDKKADLEIPYKDDDNDGIVDGTSINVHDLQVCDFDSANSKWNCLDSTIDTTTKTIKAKSNSFSLFGLLAPPRPMAAGWNLVSVPLTPSPASPASVFGTGAFFWNPTTASYLGVSSVAAGKAYWVRGGFSTIKATGTETPDASFSIPIQKGWNLVGNPFRYKVKVSDLQVNNGATTPILTAESNGLVVGTLFNYVNDAYQMSTAQDGGTMDPWKGYWILSDINGTLIVPNTPAH